MTENTYAGIPTPDVTTDPTKILENNQLLRQRMINVLMDQVTADPKVAKVVLGAMKDADSQILTLKRLEQDNVNAQSDRDMAKALHDQSTQLAMMLGNRNPFERDETNTKVPNATLVEKLIPNIELVPGQLDQGATTDSFENFITKFDDDGNLIKVE